MDDWVILAKTRWQLKKAIRIMNQILDRLKLEKHPDKTFMGRTKRGFQFLGYWITPDKLTIARETVRNAKVKAARLYEQGASQERIEQYWRHWWRWCVGGLYSGSNVTDKGTDKGTDKNTDKNTETVAEMIRGDCCSRLLSSFVVDLLG